jgi:hypothetical protein
VGYSGVHSRAAALGHVSHSRHSEHFGMSPLSFVKSQYPVATLRLFGPPARQSVFLSAWKSCSSKFLSDAISQPF